VCERELQISTFYVVAHNEQLVIVASATADSHRSPERCCVSTGAAGGDNEERFVVSEHGRTNEVTDD
jgi:hypothetical protein